MAESRDIETFYRIHAGSVHGYLVSLCRNRTLAEDLMQETFIKATRALGGYRGGSPRAWLFAIARTVFLDHVRREARRPTAAEDRDLPETSESDYAEVDAIERALGTLPERQRTALLLSDRVGLSGAEVAETIGTPKAPHGFSSIVLGARSVGSTKRGRCDPRRDPGPTRGLCGRDTRSDDPTGGRCASRHLCRMSGDPR